MPLTVPFIACRISDDLPDAVAALDAALQSGTKTSQAAQAGKLITEASCDLLDAFFGQLMLSLQAQDPASPVFREAVAVVEDIKGKLRHYLGWVTGFFSNERLAPVVAHYRSLMTMLPVDGVPQAHLAFSISPALAAEAKASLDALRDGSASDAKAGIEVLIRVIDEALQPLLYVPKQRMKFNFVVDKTLNGVISLTQTLSFRTLRKIGEQMPPAHQPVLANHLQQFLVTRSQAQAA